MLLGVRSANKEVGEDTAMTKQNSDFYFRPENPEPVRASGSVQFAIGWLRNRTLKRSSNTDSVTSGTYSKLLHNVICFTS